VRSALGFLSLALAFALATWVLGWIAVPVVALVFGAIATRRRTPVESLVAASLAWLALLGVQAIRGPVGDVARLLGRLVGVPPWVIVAITLLLAASLAWSGAVLGREIGRAARTRRQKTAPSARPESAAQSP
jgi:hypothetical protein